MGLALSLGRRGLGQTWPNPAVGCVLVKNNRLLARGWTQAGGRPHAERHALDWLPEGAARGAVAYVTLEPCSHTGQTPPCAEALIAAGVVRVVVAIEDPDPRVSGQGLARLRAAGIKVTCGVLAEEATADQRGFLTRILRGRPFVTLKLASSFDGRIATATGESQWITGPEARQYVQVLRATHDAVLVGGNTARADLPALTLRGMGERRPPVRIVASAGLDIPTTGPLAEDQTGAPVWLLHGPNPPPEALAFWAKRANCREVALDAQGCLNMAAAMNRLGEAGLTRVLCEGGGQLAASLLRAGLVDQVVGFTAGVMLGADGLPNLGALEVAQLADAPRFELAASRPVGEDLMHIWTRRDSLTN